ncbi:hypothetical protein H7F15_03825 [Pontibacter sp. Tf4]|uniref:hypothetical protein n=1 Tax=Pontibacter sp. Tf4 TaxID=2761620 RepID=UPI00162847C7|nr:hypothetical protein [Pontibacter sp. Tf4]MBB6610157.1 hypothetical protein [Pontibacter sp. Tf4]
MSVALSREEEKNKRIAAGVSVVVHAILLLLLIYILAWRAPDPPAAEMGIELNFGMDNVGSGDVQTTATPNESKNVEDSKPAPTQPDVQPEPEPAVQPTPPRPTQAPKVQTTTADAPVSVKEVEKPQPKPQPKEEPVKEPEKPKALYPGKTSATAGTGKSGTSSEATGNNNGDNPGTVGDKGNPDGKLDAKALYGKAGGGAGGALNMAGWGWGDIPKPRDTSSETGKVVIRIKISPDGIVENAVVVESTVSSQVAEIYRMEVFKKATFVRLGGNTEYSKGATGYITYTIKER